MMVKRNKIRAVSMLKDVVIMFGGISPEHEVSILTGLQILENLDKEKYVPYVVYVNKKGSFEFLSGIKTRKDFFKAKRNKVDFARDEKGGYFSVKGLLQKRVYPYCVYLAFHGGGGEGGSIQGLLEMYDIPYTSPSRESSSIAMNKQITKDLVEKSGVPIVPGLSFLSEDIERNAQKVAREIVSELDLPLIVKPVHLGSSIGVKVVKEEVELEKGLIEASRIDTEVLVEKYLSGISEFNCSVMRINGEIVTSEIEKPISKEEILSFSAKYQKGGKKMKGGMASLNREIPAKISSELRETLTSYSKLVYKTCRCNGVVRIDFMRDEKGDIFLTEVNPIPGSLAFYLWEASGYTFKEQISLVIEESVINQKSNIDKRFDYKTDIVEKFVNG